MRQQLTKLRDLVSARQLDRLKRNRGDSSDCIFTPRKQRMNAGALALISRRLLPAPNTLVLAGALVLVRSSRLKEAAHCSHQPHLRSH